MSDLPHRKIEGILPFIAPSAGAARLTPEAFDAFLEAELRKPVVYRPRQIVASPVGKIYLDVHMDPASWMEVSKPWLLRLRDAGKALRSWVFVNDEWDEVPPRKEWTLRRAWRVLRVDTRRVLTGEAQREIEWRKAELEARRKIVRWGVRITEYPEGRYG